MSDLIWCCPQCGGDLDDDGGAYHWCPACQQAYPPLAYFASVLGEGLLCGCPDDPAHGGADCTCPCHSADAPSGPQDGPVRAAQSQGGL